MIQTLPLQLHPHLTVGEIKVLFALLDAAEGAGLMRNSPVEAKWRKARVDLMDTAYETEGLFLWGLLNELDRSQALAGSWIQDRWRTIKMQAERAKELTNHPF